MGRSLNEIAKNDPRLLEPLELFASCTANCVQVVLMPFMKDEPSQVNAAVMDMTADLGGGVAGMGYVCGALMGATMVLSWKLKAENLAASERERVIREFIHQFGKENGTLFCCGIKTMAGKDYEYEACQVLVVNTIEAVDHILDHRSTK